MKRAALLLLAAARAQKEPNKRFCLGGHATAHGPYRICCPAACGACEENDACRARPPGGLACCPVSGVLASRRRCSRRKDDACYARDDDPAFFPWLAVDAVSRAHASSSSVDGAFPFPRTELKETGLQTFQAGPRKNYGHVYVAVAADRAHYVGLIACIGSVFAASRDPYRLRVSAIIPARGVRDSGALRRALKCRVRRGHVDVVEFDARKALRRVDVKAPRGPGYGNLRSPANFARFFLPELLPDADRVVYLDADAIVVRDVAALYDSAPQAVVAAAPRPQRACYDANDARPGMFLCEHLEAFAALGVADPAAMTTFNAGVVVIDLKRWRALGLSEKFVEATRAHAQHKLWRLGSNPPLVLLAHGRFEALDPRWNCDGRGAASFSDGVEAVLVPSSPVPAGLGWKKPTDLDAPCLRHGAYIWHWSGPRKPWLADGLYPQLWWPHVRDARCLLGLPGVPLNVTR
jgi:alpha-1,4-galacturonosyltransferase